MRRPSWRWAVVTTAIVAAVLFPLYWAVISSFTPESRLFAAPSLVPEALVLDHYRALFDARDFWTPIRNSLIVAGMTTLLSVTLGAGCAYALARLQFPGKAVTLAFVLAVSMFPQISIVSPLYLMLREVGLLNTYPGLVLPYLTFAMPLTIWMLVGFFRQLPAELEEAAFMDGASWFQMMWRVLLPAAMPGLIAAGMFAFMTAWNDYLFAVILTSTTAAKTLPVVVAGFATDVTTERTLMATSGVLAIIPPLLLAFLFQRLIIQGLTSGAVKD